MDLLDRTCIRCLKRCHLRTAESKSHFGSSSRLDAFREDFRPLSDIEGAMIWTCREARDIKHDTSCQSTAHVNLIHHTWRSYQYVRCKAVDNGHHPVLNRRLITRVMGDSNPRWLGHHCVRTIFHLGLRPGLGGGFYKHSIFAVTTASGTRRAGRRARPA